MTKGERAFGIIFVTGAAAFIVYKLQQRQAAEAGVQANPLTPLLPGNPSPVAEDRPGGGATNPLDAAFRRITQAFKLPGNSTSLTVQPSKLGTSVNPLKVPSDLGAPLQPAKSSYLGERDYGYIPNLGDPNMTAWNYIASTPPELAWGLVSQYQGGARSGT